MTGPRKTTVWPRGRRRGDARGGHLGRRRHHQLDGVLERLAGAGDEDVAGAGADVDGEHAGLRCGGHGGEVLGVTRGLRPAAAWARR